MSTVTPRPWTVTAVNLPEHAGNRIHTDDGAREAGFPGALVAGVTSYAYLTHPVVEAWGTDWLHGGGAEVRFRAPVLAGDPLTCTPVTDGDEMEVALSAPRATGALAVLRAWPVAAAPVHRDGEVLRPYEIPLVGRYGPDLGRRLGDDLDVYEREGLVHPSVWPDLANHVFHRELVRGSWIHTRSRIGHHAPARVGGTAVVRTTVVDRFVRSGLRAVADVAVEVDGVLVATLEHEAIVDLAPH